jgi:hypothetical protein
MWYYRPVENLLYTPCVFPILTRDADALLEGDGVVILARINLLGDAAVGTVSTDDQVHLKCGGGADLGALSVAIVVDGDGAVRLCRCGRRVWVRGWICVTT